MDLGPLLVLSVWSAGVAAGGAVVAWWRVVGPGYNWMSGATVLGLGLATFAADGGWAAFAGAMLGGLSVVLGKRPEVVGGLMTVATILFLVVASTVSPWVPALSGALFMGAVTTEMLLGHWFLVDPRLPRWSLQWLALAGGLGLLTEVAIVIGRSVGAGGTDEMFYVWAYLALAVMTALLITGVWFSLAEPRYTGVMAATGLSYLAILTAFGVFVVGRLVAYG